MRLRHAMTAVLALALALAPPQRARSQQTAEELYQAGLYQEQVQGDLQRAIDIYQRILKEHPQNRVVDAQAQLHIGLCYEALGQTEAQRAYRSVIQNYADQADVVAQARTRLAALAPEAVASKGPVARLIFTNQNPADRIFQNPRLIVPSPDGRYVAYLQTAPGTEGIYTRDLATGRSERVTPEGQGVEYGMFTWSADGKRIAFQETDNATKVGVLRMVDVSTRTLQTVPGLDARALLPVDWSDDGRYLLCNNNRATTLEVVTVADGSTKTLSDSVWSAQRASFSPDGRYVAYGAGVHTHETLYVHPLAGGPRVGIAEAGGDMYLHPLWSPDGSAIAYQESDGIWVQPMKDGTPDGPARLAYRTDAARWVAAWTKAGGLYFESMNQENVPMEVEVDPRTARAVGRLPSKLEGYPNLYSFSWSSDRGSVAANAWWEGFTVYSPEAGTTKAFEHVEPQGVMIHGGIWSPDGREIWYEAQAMTPPASTGVRGLDVATGAVRQVFPPLPNRAGLATLSADARTWAFLRPEADRSISVVVAPAGQADGRVVAKLNLPGEDRLDNGDLVHLSPRGDQVFYVLQRGGRRGQTDPDAGTLWVVGADGTGARKVATAPSIETALWSSDGRFIAFSARNADGNTVLQVVEVATGAVHEIPMEETRSRIELNDWSRDGRHIGFVQLKNWWEYWAVQGLLDQGGSR